MVACSVACLQAQEIRSSQPGPKTIELQLSAPTLIAPAHHSRAIRINTVFKWNATPGADSYDLQISSDTTFSKTLFGCTGLRDTIYSIRGLSHGATYYWKVSARSLEGITSLSDVFDFRARLTPGVNGNGEITSAMAASILRHAVGLAIMSGDAFEVAEVSGDWTLSAFDAALVLQAAAGFLSTFPVDQ